MVWRSLILFGILLHLFANCFAKRAWVAEFVSASATSSDESKLNVSMRTERVGREKIVLSGVFDWKFDTDETTMIEMHIYSCHSGSEMDYTELPYKIPRITFANFIENFYEDIVYKNAGQCSNMKNNLSNFQPFPKITYKFKHCEFDGSGFPDVLPVGYYKVVFNMSGPVELHSIFVLQVSLKLI